MARTRRFSAISVFTRLTLARSALHQGVFVAIAACGAGLVMNSFIGAMNMDARVRSPENEIVNTVVAAPFTLVFVTVLAVRAALVLPIEPRANWVFRMTEDPGTRAEQLGAVVHTVVRFGVLWPVVVLLPVQWAVLGPRALICASIAFLAGLVLVELHMGDWLRIPFTCSYMPGKRFVGNTMLHRLRGVRRLHVLRVGPCAVRHRTSHRRAGRDGDPRRRGDSAAAPPPLAVAGDRARFRRRPADRGRAAEAERVLKRRHTGKNRGDR